MLEHHGKENFENIYASKDGIIESIDVSSGNVMVKVNDYVKRVIC